MGERAGREEDEGGETSQKSYSSERWKHDVNSAEMRAGKGSRVSLRLQCSYRSAGDVAKMQIPYAAALGSRVRWMLLVWGPHFESRGPRPTEACAKLPGHEVVRCIWGASPGCSCR